ncbi:MAG TPA: glutathione S-transferase N-terminal domain-containing protein [Gammaproteobacteria bacterium]|nr:glutathione S-transferase N-terminal domain-containing protein [Gammaproteobacteria bacterium]
MIRLYDYERSGNCYKVRLLLALLGLPWERVPVDLRRGEERRPEFLALNPRGQVPVLTDGDWVVWDSQAILVYLARRYGGAQWLPQEARPLAEVQQ